jgi:hypothetical protein
MRIQIIGMQTKYWSSASQTVFHVEGRSSQPLSRSCASGIGSRFSTPLPRQEHEPSHADRRRIGRHLCRPLPSTRTAGLCANATAATGSQLAPVTVEGRRDDFASTGTAITKLPADLHDVARNR